MSRKSRFRRPFDKQHGKQSEISLKSARHHLYHIYWPLWRQLIWKKSALAIWKMLGLLVNTLTTHDKYSLLNKDNFNTIVLKLSLLRRKILIVFCVIWIWIKFWAFSKKDDPHSWWIFGITNSERCG